MGTILILVGYYLDYRNGPKSFLTDLSGGLTLVMLLFIVAVILKIFNVSLVTIAFSVGLELFLIFVIKSFIDSSKNKAAVDEEQQKQLSRKTSKFR